MPHLGPLGWGVDRRAGFVEGGGGKRDKIVVCLYTARAIYIYLVHIKDHQSGPGRQSNGSLRLVSVERSVAPMNDGSVLQLVDR